MKHYYSLWTSLFLILMACQQNNQKQPIMKKAVKTNFENCKQFVVVISPNDSSVVAMLQAFDLIENKWQATASAHPVSLGRTGLAPGRGIHPKQLLEGKEKQEGDGKSPAGIFKFGKAFGYAKQADVRELKLSYNPISEVTQCIEDGHSKYYNQIIDNTKTTKDWKETDFMLRKDDLYKWGVFIEHNTPASDKKGSCIFMHLWRGYGKPTAGCTAMTEENMLRLLEWLEPEKEPLLVQLTEEDYKRFSEVYELP